MDSITTLNDQNGTRHLVSNGTLDWDDDLPSIPMTPGPTYAQSHFALRLDGTGVGLS
jgi:hypothetical protein